MTDQFVWNELRRPQGGLAEARHIDVPNNEHAACDFRCRGGASSSKITESGEMSEWSKEHAWKVCIRKRIEGSNPSLTAISSHVFPLLHSFTGTFPASIGVQCQLTLPGST